VLSRPGLARRRTARRPGDRRLHEDLAGYFKFRRSTVRRCAVEAPAVKIYCDRTSITVSDQHQFVVQNAARGCGHVWKAAGDLVAGDRVLYLGEPWEPESSREAGWLAGLYDGEGHVSGSEVSVAQNPGPVLDTARDALVRRGYNVFGGNPNGGKCCSLRISQRYDRMRLLGTLRPIRLLAQADKVWVDGAVVARNGVNRYATVRKLVRETQPSSFFAIQTSTRTLITDGLFSHNCNNWAISTQLPYYPEFTTGGGREMFVRKITSFGRGPLLMGLDFGVRRPALLVGQANPKKTRLYFLREWSPVGITSVPFLEVCEWLMGELPKRALSPEALVHVLELDRAHVEGRGPAVPWFIDPPEVKRYTSQEALRTSQEVTGESRERRLVDIWESRGFPLNVHYAQVKAGGDVIRHILRKPDEGKLPFCIIDPACKLFVEGLEGGYTFKRGTRENPMPSEPVKDGKFEHLQDCAKYIASNAIDMKAVDDGKDDEQRIAQPAVLDTKPKREARDVYSREVKDDTGEGFSSPFDPGSARRDWDERKEY
jgi:hypothetical protein